MKSLLIAIFLITSLGTQTYAMDEEEHHKVWKLNNIHDLGVHNSSNCENAECGRKIRYVYSLEHTLSKETKRVGCICAARMIENVEKIFKWEPFIDDWPPNYDHLRLHKFDPKTQKFKSEKPMVQAFKNSKDNKYFYNINGPKGPFNTMTEAQKAALKEYLRGERD